MREFKTGISGKIIVFDGENRGTEIDIYFGINPTSEQITYALLDPDTRQPVEQDTGEDTSHRLYLRSLHLRGQMVGIQVRDRLMVRYDSLAFVDLTIQECPGMGCLEMKLTAQSVNIVVIDESKVLLFPDELRLTMSNADNNDNKAYISSLYGYSLATTMIIGLVFFGLHRTV